VATHYLQKPELSELLAIKFPDLGSVAWAALNEVAFRVEVDAHPRASSR